MPDDTGAPLPGEGATWADVLAGDAAWWLGLGDCRATLAAMPAGSVHCVVTSPPYFGLRDYGHAGQIGLEPTPDAYVAALVATFAEVRRVLRDDGVAWLNLGDSFGDDTKWGGAPGGKATGGLHGAPGIGRGKRETGALPGSLLGIPWRVALALQADGWTLRQAVTWCKVAPMPESVAGTRWERCRVKVASQPPPTQGYAHATSMGDGRARDNPGGGVGGPNAALTGAEWSPCPGCPRCAPNDGYVLRRGSWRHTSATEQVFMLTKGMAYWADQEAVREAHGKPTRGRNPNGAVGVDYKSTTVGNTSGNHPTGFDGHLGFGPAGPAGRNPRNWVTPRPSPFPGAHFATFPPSLIEPFIRATCPARCCPTCGAGWAPVVERAERPHVDPSDLDRYGTGEAGVHRKVGQAYQDWKDANPDRVVAYRQTCACPPAAPVPGVCLDPFAGAGTTGLVSVQHFRRALGIELNAAYRDMAAARIGAACLARQPALFTLDDGAA